jgi:hypothetical protein
MAEVVAYVLKELLLLTLQFESLNLLYGQFAAILIILK